MTRELKVVKIRNFCCAINERYGAKHASKTKKELDKCFSFPQERNVSQTSLLSTWNKGGVRG